MAFEELKQRQSVMWASAPFENYVHWLADMHDDLVERLAPQPGERWLDVATGTGEVAFRAAEAGAEVTASDLAPGLIETAKRIAAERGFEIDFHVADCERLPYDDASFDVVSSAVGVIFAPDHRAAAAELARVTRPGGRIGLTNWKVDTGVHDMFKVMAPFQPTPPPGVGSPFDWGRKERVRELLGEAFDLDFVERDSPQTGESGEWVWQAFLDTYGPSRTLANSLEPKRREELARAMVDFFEQYRDGDGVHQPRAYYVVLGTRR
jgi:SAM-dependent methyltransferase